MYFRFMSLLIKIHKMKLEAIAFFLIFGLINIVAFGQEEGKWKQYTSKDGEIHVSSKISNGIDEDGNKLQIVEYKSYTTTNLVSLSSCSNLLSNISMHKEIFQNTEQSETIKVISEDEWLIYYFFNPPWPVPKSDCITTFKRFISEDQKTICFQGVATPDLFEEKEVKRMILSDAEYEFQEIETGEIKISIHSKFSPVVSAPKFLVNAWFPNGPIKVMENIIEAAKKTD